MKRKGNTKVEEDLQNEATEIQESVDGWINPVEFLQNQICCSTQQPTTNDDQGDLKF